MSLGIYLLIFGMHQIELFEKDETDSKLIATPKEHTDKPDGTKKENGEDSFLPPTQEKVNSKVNDLQSSFKLNMTQD
ncbi:hypothetical protein CN378_03295 [Bacillus sp. AFS015802]|nr:hypothetical protein CN378_03295 [Bacillus sp. AFS015802]